MKDHNDNNHEHSGGARPMAVHVDSSGHWWLCDKHVQTGQDFESQGCWRYDQMAFDRND